jgi:hypothetical protein
MPRGRSGEFQGNYGSYPGAGDDGGWAKDDDAVAEAVDMMFSMCGNAGQEAIIGNGLEAFDRWGIEALEGINGNNGDYGHYIDTIVEATSYDAWYGSQIIWDEGYNALSAQSHYHDGKPDVGETGQEF